MIPSVRIQSYPQLSEDEKKRLYDFLYGIFGESYKEMTWATDDWIVQVSLQDQLVTLVELIERTVRVGELAVNVVGVGGVSTLLEYRGQGYASLALKEAERFLREELKVSFGLLITNEQLAPFYQHLGWQRIDAPAVFDQPDGKWRLDGVAMFLPGTEETWPPGPLDFCGYPW